MRSYLSFVRLVWCYLCHVCFFFFKQKTAYEMRISDWSSDVCSSDLQIQLIGPKGNFQRIEMPREAFLSGLSKSTPRVNSAELNRRLKASFENSDVALTDMKFEPIGRDGNAVYFSMRMNMSVGESSRPISGISPITHRHSLPLSIKVYAGTGSTQRRAQTQTDQQ